MIIHAYQKIVELEPIMILETGVAVFRSGVPQTIYSQTHVSSKYKEQLDRANNVAACIKLAIEKMRIDVDLSEEVDLLLISE